MTQATETELLPCPFCGGRHKPQVREGQRGKAVGIYIWCSECGASGRLFTYDPIIPSGKSTATEQAIAAWSTRPSSPAGGELERLFAIGAELLAAFGRGAEVHPNAIEMGKVAFVSSMREHAAALTRAPISEEAVVEK